MGEQRKKNHSWRRGILSVLMAFACFLLAAGVYCLDPNGLSARLKSLHAYQDSNSDIFWYDLRSDSFASLGGDNIYYINTPGQLAYMNYFLTNSSATGMFAGATFILENDIKLNNAYSESLKKFVTPYWTPVKLGLNHNITFDGNGYTIEGMNLKYNDGTARSVGFFGDMVGGVVKNVTFKDPIITYEYKGDSRAKNDPLRPNAPVDVSVGVVAGSIDSTYVQNITIENPTVEFVSENTNGHNFYVGTAVGKMSFTSTYDESNQTKHSPNTATPTKWGLDTVKVYKTSTATATGVKMTIKSGSAEGATYGEATAAYLGGLVGANISSKIINSTVRDYPITPVLETGADTKIAGYYYVGSLTGLSTQITTRRELRVAAGLYNNLILNVTLGDAHDKVEKAENYFGGNLVGRIYSGAWLYNNIVMENNGLPYADLWGRIDNSSIYCVSDEKCIGHINGAIEDYQAYFLQTGNSTYDCSYTSSAKDNGEKYYYCAKHATSESGLHDSGNKDKMKEYNFIYTSVEDSSYQTLLTGTTDIHTDPTNPDYIETYKNIDLLNNFNYTEGSMYWLAVPIVEYEVGLTVNAYNEDAQRPADEEDKRLDAVYQFRTWSVDENNKPSLTGYFGLDYSVTFVANSPIDLTRPYSEAYWKLVNEETGRVEKLHELVIPRTYQQIIYKPEYPREPELVCEGYLKEGYPKWKIEGLVDGSPEMVALQNKGVIDEFGFYIFDRERIMESGRRFIAEWGDPQVYTVNFIVREEGCEDVPYKTDTFPGVQKVTYGNTVSSPGTTPKSTQGLSFVGWFLKNDLPGEGKDADPDKQWIFGKDSGYTMPGRDIDLYTGWVNNFTMLNLLLKDPKYVLYYENYQNYFADDVGNAFGDAYARALEARDNEDTSNIGGLLIRLQDAYTALRIDPNKLLNLPAFDNSRLENSCQFLYDRATRLYYENYKDEVRKYINNALADEKMLVDIEAFILYYDELNRLFDELKDNLHESVIKVGGLQAVEIQDLIEQYQKLYAQYGNLNRDRYENNSLEILDAAAELAATLWAGDGFSVEGPHLSDVRDSVNAMEQALTTLQPKSTSGSGSSGGSSSGGSAAVKNGVSPILIGILIVLLLAVAVGGYIGVDFYLDQRRNGGFARATAKAVKTKTTQATNTAKPNSAVSFGKVAPKVEAETDDDETYI